MNQINYNVKSFLLPDSFRSMSCYHAKVMEDGIMKFTLHDCKHSIQLKNDLNNPEEVDEAIEKLYRLSKGIIALMEFITINYAKQDTAFAARPNCTSSTISYISRLETDFVFSESERFQTLNEL
jgi:hypothetical protein